MYHEYAFGPGELTWDLRSPSSGKIPIDRPETPGGVVEMLERGHRLLVGDLDGLQDDEQLDVPTWTNWGRGGPPGGSSGR